MTGNAHGEPLLRPTIIRLKTLSEKNSMSSKKDARLACLYGRSC